MSLNLPPQYTHRLLQNEPLAKYTAARLGGAADWLYIAKESNDELIEVVTAAWAADVPVRLLGGGSNVLVSDKGVRGLVVVNHIADLSFDGLQVHVSAGYNLTTLARKSAARGLAGFEWAASVPGTVGGAVVNNAGAHGGDMAGCVRQIELLDAEHGRQTLALADLAYGYRASSLKSRADKRFLVLNATLELEQGDPAEINATIDAFVAYRKRTQPPGASLGSIFKNPPDDYAGRLIESCGLKGYSIGGAQVSPVHANFFINREGATAEDYYRLIQYVREVVHLQTGLLLETEIELMGEWA
jgi:UDP-N-acetylmuramate dehydrogenase